MEPLLDALAATLGCPPERAEMALAMLTADVQTRCRTLGEASYDGLGTFRAGPDGLTFEPDAALAIVVNHRFAGMEALPTADPPSPVWDPAPTTFLPITPAEAALPEGTIFFPWQDPEPEPIPGPTGATTPPAEAHVGPHERGRAAPPVSPAAQTSPSIASAPPVVPLEEIAPVYAAPRSARGWMLPVVLLVLAGVLGTAAYLWWRHNASAPTPPAPVAARIVPATPADSLQPDSSTIRADTAPAPSPAPPPPAPARAETDRPLTSGQLDATPAPRPPTPRSTAPARTPTSRPVTPTQPAPARASVPPSGEATQTDALRGQEPVEPGHGGWTIVVGGAGTEGEAEAAARPLRLRGYRTGVLAGLRADSTPIYRIGLGHFATGEAARTALEQHRGDLFPADAWILRLR